LAAIWRFFAFIEAAHRCRSMMKKKTAFSMSTEGVKSKRILQKDRIAFTLKVG
jgi:hypothetical protein